MAEVTSDQNHVPWINEDLNKGMFVETSHGFALFDQVDVSIYDKHSEKCTQVNFDKRFSFSL